MPKMMQPGSFEFKKEVPRTRVWMNGPGIRAMLLWSVDFRIAYPSRWKHRDRDTEAKLLDSLERISRQTPKTRLSLTAIDCAVIFGWAPKRLEGLLQGDVYDSLRRAQKRLPVRIEEKSKHLGNLPLFKDMDFAALGDVPREGE